MHALDRPLVEHRLDDLSKEQRSDERLLQRLRANDDEEMNVTPEEVARVEAAITERASRIDALQQQLLEKDD